MEIEMVDDFNDDLDTPTEADLDTCYGSKYLSATDLGDPNCIRLQSRSSRSTNRITVH